jgi:SAM-dependent methyltransferase
VVSTCFDPTPTRMPCATFAGSVRQDMAHSTGWYDAHAADLADRYEAIEPARLHGWLGGLLPAAPGTVLDIGAGSGRDAAWFSGQGYDVIAAEPSSGMRSEAQRLHPNPRIRWINDQLPELSILGPLAITFDVVMLTAVWQHVPPPQRDRAFRKLTGLLRSGGLLAISLRSGPSPAGSGMHPVSLEEIERLARNHGFAVEKVQHSADQQGRTDVSWTNVALRLPDDGTGALPLLRRVILNDQKSATYKLGLLRALRRAADGSAGMVQIGTKSPCALRWVSSRSIGCACTCRSSAKASLKHQRMLVHKGSGSQRKVFKTFFPVRRQPT